MLGLLADVLGAHVAERLDGDGHLGVGAIGGRAGAAKPLLLGGELGGRGDGCADTELESVY